MSFKINVNEFYAGDSIQAIITSDLYESDKYELSLVLINAKRSYQVDCDIKDKGWELNLSKDITKDFVDDKYRLFYIVTDSADFFKQIEGTIVEIKPNIIDAKLYDDRTELQKRLQTIRDLIDGRLVEGINNFTINGRSVTLMSITELNKLEEEYEFKVSNELGLIDKKEKGRTNRNMLKIRYKGINV